VAEGYAAPTLNVTVNSAHMAGETVWLRFDLNKHDWTVGAFAVSLDLDGTAIDLDAVDANGDGRPDQLSFPTGKPSVAGVSFDAATGRLKVLLADLSQQALADGSVLEVGLVARAADDLNDVLWLADAPRLSFGLVGGTAVQGEVRIQPLFIDGFESGDVRAWSSAVGVVP
jgi:hypothetical protein